MDVEYYGYHPLQKYVASLVHTHTHKYINLLVIP